MGESLGLLLIAAAVYAWECVVLVPRDALALRASMNAWPLPVFGRDLFGTRARGMFLANPVPLFGTTLLLSPWWAFASAVELERRMNLSAIAERDRVARGLAMPLRILGTLVLLAVFVAFPASIVTGNLGRAWLPLGLFVLLGHVALVAESSRAHRLLHGAPRAGKETWLLAVSPLTSVRAADLLLRDAFVEFDPLAVAYCICDAATFGELARTVARDVRSGEWSAPAESTRPGIADDYMTGVRRLLRAAGLRDGHLAISPAPADALSRSYCPECMQQYALAQGSCSSCGVSLHALEAESDGVHAALAERIGARQRKLRERTRRT